MPIVRMLRSGQLTIPAELRHDLGMDEGADILVTPDGQGGLRLRPLPAVMPLDELVGSLKPAHPVDVDAARRGARQDAADRFSARAASALSEQEAGFNEQAATRVG